MKKWGLRLISAYFLFGAGMIYIGIITRENYSSSFLGTSFVLLTGDSPDSMAVRLNITALIGLCIYVYITYNLLKFKNQGRVWALAALWYSAFFTIVDLILFSTVKHLSLTKLFIKLNLFSRTVTLPYLVLPGILITLYVIQIYFLMRKDVKMEFQKQETPEPKPAAV